MTADAHASGLWVSTTLADTLRDAAVRDTRADGTDRRRDAGHLLRPLRQLCALARNLLSRMPAGSVVSFMLPNWHEAAVVYLGATLAGMVVNPILPSLRDRELASSSTMSTVG